MNSMPLLAIICTIFLVGENTALGGEVVQPLSDADVLTEKYNTLLTFVETIVEDNTIKGSKLNELTEKYNVLVSLVHNIEEDNNLKGSQINGLTEAVENLKDENKLKDKKLEAMAFNMENIISENKLNVNKIQLLQNRPLANYDSTDKGYANLMSDFKHIQDIENNTDANDHGDLTAKPIAPQNRRLQKSKTFLNQS